MGVDYRLFLLYPAIIGNFLLILSDPKPDFFNPEVDKSFIDKFVKTHSNEENKIFLVKRKTDYLIVQPEIKDLILINNYKLNGEPVSEERRLILTGLTKYYYPSEKKKIREFFINLLKRHETLILQTIDIYLPLYEQDAENSQSSSSIKNEFIPIDYLGPCKERDRLFKALHKNGYLGAYTKETLEYRVRCINSKDKDIDDEHEYPMFIWLKKNGDLACLVNYLGQKKRIKSAKKWKQIKNNFAKEDGTRYNNLSQDNYNAGDEINDYENPELKKLLDSVLCYSNC